MCATRLSKRKETDEEMVKCMCMTLGVTCWVEKEITCAESLDIKNRLIRQSTVISREPQGKEETTKEELPQASREPQLSTTLRSGT